MAVITTLNQNDSGSTSRVVINTNFANLNAALPDLSLYATLASPTFTGTVVLPSTTSIGTVSSTELGYLDGVTSALQVQIDAKAPTASPTLTGSVTTTQVISTNNAITAVANAATVPITSKVNTVTNSSAATLTITMATASAVNRQACIVCILDFSAVAQTITWVNTENSTASVPTTSNGSTTLPLTVGFIYNVATSKWRCVASA